MGKKEVSKEQERLLGAIDNVLNVIEKEQEAVLDFLLSNDLKDPRYVYFLKTQYRQTVSTLAVFKELIAKHKENENG